MSFGRYTVRSTSNSNILFIGFFAFVLISSCSQEKNTLLSKSYHNLTARYNAYFLAKERLKTVDEKINSQQKYDYNDILRYYPEYDSNATKAFDQDFAYIIEKCLIPINKHKNSNWVDDSYILIGKCKLYREKLDSAALLFKYTNTHSDYDPDRFRALSLLMRTYLNQKEFQLAEEVYNFLKRQKLTTENKRDLNLAAFEFFRIERNNDSMLVHIEDAIPHIKKKDDKSRAHYIAGQLNQRLGKNKLAYKHYKKILKKTPPYELEFNTRVNLAQVTEINDKNTLKKTKKYFVKLLEDEKNTEFQDRIYYEMARFELKQDNLQRALYYLHKSLHSEGKTPNQKTYSYLLTGQLYYHQVDSLPKVEKYTNAKLYYDSTVASMREGFKDYDEIKERNVILADFVDQITTIYTQDSLLALANLSKDELAARVEQIKTQKEKELKAEYEEKKRREEAALRQQQNQNNTQQNIISNPNSGFVFYDQVALFTSKQKFLEKWGNRPLEDHWRRSTKDISFEDDLTNSSITDDTISTALTANDSIREIQSKEPEFNVSAESIMADIPSSDAEKAAAKAKIDDAQYRLGKIYHFQLEESENAVNEFQQHLDRFSTSEHRAEIIYMLYLICKDVSNCDPSVYANMEKEEFPNSIYTKLINNPNYLDDNQSANAAAHNMYERAYKKYESGQYLETRKVLERLRKEHPNNDIMDNIAILYAKTFAKTDQVGTYQNLLRQFLNNYKTSDLQEYAQQLLAAIDPATVNFSNETSYTVSTDTNEYMLLTFNKNELEPARAKQIIDEFNDSYFPREKLTYRSVDFKDSTFLVVVKTIKGKSLKQEYEKKFLHFLDFRKVLENVNFDYYFIDPRNYNVLLNTKNLNGYREFHQKYAN